MDPKTILVGFYAGSTDGLTYHPELYECFLINYHLCYPLFSCIMSTRDPFESDTSAHEAFIRATLVAETNYHSFIGMERVEGPTDQHAWCPGDDPIDLIDGRHDSHDSQGAHHGGGDKCGSHKQHSIKITTSTPFLYFGHDVLIDRVTSLQKRALVAKWHFVEVAKAR